MRRKKNKVYLEAAISLVHRPYMSKHSCVHLNFQSTASRLPNLCYRHLFCPFDDQDNKEKDWWNGPKTPKNQLARSLALLFAYEMGL